MADQPFDVRKVIEQSASKTTLQELAKKGIHRVKVLDEQMINKLIHDAVEHIIGSKTNLLSDTDREKLVQASRQELDKLIKEFNQQKDKSELLQTDKTQLAAEVENLQRQLQLQRQLGDQLGKQALEQGKSFAKQEIDMLQRRLELAQQEVDAAKRHGGAVKEAELNQKVMAEMQKNSELSQQLAKTLQDMRTRDDEIAKKMESLFTKSIEGISKKLSDLRLRSVAGAPAGSMAGMGEDFRPSEDFIANMMQTELKSNIDALKPTEGQTAGKLGSALDRLKAMRGMGGEKKEGEGEKK